MKRLFFTILTLSIFAFLCTAQPLQAAAYYFDLASGNDSTGDGSYGSPWKTIDKCTTTRSAGDECRGALTAITTLAGTLTFTNGSTSVATSSDLSAVVSAGDVIGKNAATEGWWKVASVSSAAITLSYQYWGKTGSGSAVTGYKITPINASEEYDVESSGTLGSRIKISGGWDLGTQTQTGLTAFNIYSTTNGIDTKSKNYLEISHFVVSGATSGTILISGSTDVYLHDFYGCDSGATYGIIRFGNNTDCVIEDSVFTGGIGDGLYGIGVISSNLNINSVYIYSAGTGSGDHGVSLGIINGLRAFQLEVYNSYANAWTTAAASGQQAFLEFDSCIFSTVRTAVPAFYVATGEAPQPGPFNFTGCTFNGTGGTYAFLTYAEGTKIYLKNSTFVDGSSGGFSVSSSSNTLAGNNIANCVSGSDCVMYSGVGSIVHDSSAAARSGKALKFLSTIAVGRYQIYKVGTVKIPNADSNLTLNAYIKDDAGFDGRVFFTVKKDGFYISRTEKTPTTSYVKESVVVPLASLTANEYLDLYVEVSGTAGSLWVDDFSAEQ